MGHRAVLLLFLLLLNDISNLLLNFISIFSYIRIDELYESVQKYDGMAAALPDIVDRLETLQGLHQQGEFVVDISSFF